jgi:hypothetical protein
MFPHPLLYIFLAPCASRKTKEIFRNGQQENRKEREVESNEEQCGWKKPADGAVKREIKLYHAM